MNISPPAGEIEIAPGVVALPERLAYFHESRTLIAADLHLGYEEIIGGALPLWSIDETVRSLETAAARTGATEIVLLGDVIHGAHMSDGAARRIAQALSHLRERCTLTIIAGNHEGGSRGVAILGATFESVERDGYLLVHGDAPKPSGKHVIGHLHPSVHFPGGNTVPVFLANDALIVVPATTPYSPGLNVCSQAARIALRVWDRDLSLTVFAATDATVYPLGELQALRELQVRPAASSLRPYRRFRKRRS